MVIDKFMPSNLCRFEWQPRASGRAFVHRFQASTTCTRPNTRAMKGPSETNGQRETEKRGGTRGEKERERESFCSLAGRAVASEQIKRRDSHIRHGRVIRGIIN